MGSFIQAAAYVTDFADQAVLLPVAALVAGLLLLAGWPRGAAAWIVAVVGALALILVLKLVFAACGPAILGGAVESPSGHTAAAGVVYGTIFAFLAERAFGRSVVTVGVVLAVVILVGASRVLLGAHTPAEVVVGGFVGLAAALLAIRMAGPVPTRHIRISMALLPAALLVFLLHGLRLPVEARIHALALTLWPLRACR